MPSKNPSLVFEYKNWKREKGIRTVIPKRIYYGHTEWHPTDGWLLEALDIEKNEIRHFSVTDIIRFIKDSH